MKQTVKFKKLTPNAIVPTYGIEFSAGAEDVYKRQAISVYSF